MGIHGIFKELGPAPRESLVALSATHQTLHSRPLRLAIDTSIWLFQIQASKGGSNPALRTFYYRLLRLLAHNIHPLFVFDGPNKPLFKRNKKVGGPGVRVASVPEFLAKQLLKHFGFPWHVAPGEAEAECAVLQREGVVDVVMSEDVDTLMFGSGVTIRNWTANGKGKVPTHVDVWRAEETKRTSGLDREGMILVALMSGGDYIVEGIPGCGPKVACDAARAGFGRELCEIAGRRDVVGLAEWRERLQREINTNESKFFTRKSKLVIPDEFPSREVLGYYTHPCVSSKEKIERLRETLRWDMEIDFVALRDFTADAFDWRCVSGANKFIRNLAPAMLVRELRLRNSDNLAASEAPPASTYQDHIALETQEQQERNLITTIHSTRKHPSTDNSLEYRISFTPTNLVPIDLSLEDPDDINTLPPAAGDDLLSEADSNEWNTIPASTPAPDEEDEDATRTRGPSLYDPTQPQKLWLLADFLKMGCPLLIRLYEDGNGDARALLKARREARAKTTGTNIHAKGKKKKVAGSDMPRDAMLAYTTTIKSSQVSVEKDVERDGEAVERAPLRNVSPRSAAIRSNSPQKKQTKGKEIHVVEKEKNKSHAAPAFKRLDSAWLNPPQASQPTARVSSSFDQSFDHFDNDDDDNDLTPKASRQPSAPAPNPKSKPNASSQVPKKPANTTAKTKTKTSMDGHFAQFAKTSKANISRPSLSTSKKKQGTKRPCLDDDEIHGSSARSQRTIDSYFSPTPTPKHIEKGLGLSRVNVEVVDLVSSSPAVLAPHMAPPPAPPLFDTTIAGRPVREDEAGGFFRNDEDVDIPLPPSVTKRRPRRPMKRAKTMPTFGDEDEGRKTPELLDIGKEMQVEAMDLASPSPIRRRHIEPVAASTISPPPSLASPPLRRSPRHSSSTTAMLPPAASIPSTSHISKDNVSKKKKIIHLRKSLAGAYKILDVDETETLDLTGDFAGGEGLHGKGRIRAWRESGVEVLDLTED